MRDILPLVARPKEVQETAMDKDLVCRTVADWDGKSPHPLSILANHDPAYWRERRRTFVEDWKAAEEAVKALDHLYFIQAGNAVKIGRTRNLVPRLSTIQVGNHEYLNCLLVLRSRGYEEKEWHRRYSRQHIRGEWYRLSPTLKKEIEALQRAAWDDAA